MNPIPGNGTRNGRKNGRRPRRRRESKMRKSSENKMLSNSASKLKMEWMMLSQAEKVSYIVELIAIAGILGMLYLTQSCEIDPDYTLEKAGRSIAAIALCFVLWLLCDLFRIKRAEFRRTKRKKEGLRPEWTNQDLDLLDEDIEELYERVKALESRRY